MCGVVGALLQGSEFYALFILHLQLSPVPLALVQFCPGQLFKDRKNQLTITSNLTEKKWKVMLKISLWLLSPYWLQLFLVIQERVNHSPNLFLFRRGIPLSLRDAHLDEQIFLVQVYNELPRHRKVQNLYDDRRKQAGNTLIFFDQTISGICSNFLTRKLKLRSFFIDEISGFFVVSL